MKRIALLYFSGAGNTECIAKIIERIACKHGYIVSRKRITSESIDSLKIDYDILGIGYPIHFRKPPSLVSKFISNQHGKNKKIFTFCTKGMYSGNASRDILLQAKQNGFESVGNLEIYMPGTDALILMAKKGSLTEKILKTIHSRRIKNKIEKFVYLIREDSNFRIPIPKWYSFFDNGIVKPIEKHFTENYQIFVNRFNVDHSRCDLCQLCIKNCPNFNIQQVNSKVTFRSNCSFCLRCIHRCPKEAIQINKRTEKTVRYYPIITKELSIKDKITKKGITNKDRS